MKNNKKSINAAEEAKKEVQTEEKGEKLTDEQMAQVVGGKEQLNSVASSDKSTEPYFTASAALTASAAK